MGHKQAPRYRFLPDVLRGQAPDAVQAQFTAEADRFGLLWTCRDCAYVAPNGSCTVGWPNDRLRWSGQGPEPAVLWGTEPTFCKAFEPGTW